jgi:asparagine synthase (glutamine-hydrolysing)
MLWTTPESLQEKLPVIHPTRPLVLTADARLDNRAELLSSLSLSDRPTDYLTDSQLILAAYDRWGERCPAHLLGDFAFTIWDRSQRLLLCARDQFGVKPFYYYYRPGQAFLFASEIKALVSLPDVPHQINEVRIADYLYPLWEDQSITAYQDIWRLPPGHTLTIQDEHCLHLKRYWTLEIPDELKLSSHQEYAEAFRDIFTEAVRCRLRSAFPVGCHLSGGLDSSSVTGMARHLLTQNSGAQLHTFSNIFDQVTECDERAYIEPILQPGGMIPHFIHPDEIGPLSEWQQLFPRNEEPCLLGGNGFLVQALNRATQQAGVRVVLDGFDGDTTVGHGWGYFAELATQGQWATFAAEAEAIAQHFPTSPAAILRRYGFTYLQTLAQQWRWLTFAQTVHGMKQYFRVSPRRLWKNLGFKTILPPLLLKGWRSLRQRQELPTPTLSLINPEFADRIGIQDRACALERTEPPLLSAREEQWYALTSGKFTRVLEQVDLTAAAFSIAACHPFMDKRLIEFCLALPAAQKLDQGWSRMVLRRAMQGILPESVQWRGGKTDMSPNFRHGLLRFNRELLDEAVLSSSAYLDPYINQDSLKKSYKQLVSGGNVTDNQLNIVWTALGLVLWLRQFKALPSKPKHGGTET